MGQGCCGRVKGQREEGLDWWGEGVSDVYVVSRGRTGGYTNGMGCQFAAIQYCHSHTAQQGTAAQQLLQTRKINVSGSWPGGSRDLSALEGTISFLASSSQYAAHSVGPLQLQVVRLLRQTLTSVQRRDRFIALGHAVAVVSHARLVPNFQVGWRSRQHTNLNFNPVLFLLV